MIAAAFLFGLLAIQDAEPAVTDVPVRTTITEIHEDPWAWHGRTVRVVGEFDRCSGYDCSVCDTIEPHHQDTAEQAYIPTSIGSPECAGISFRLGFRADEIVRFNTVLFEARYSADCSNVQNPAFLNDHHQESQMRVVCTDRASEFEDSIILDVMERRPSTTIRQYGPAELIEAQGGLAHELIAAYWRAIPYEDAEDHASTPVFPFVLDGLDLSPPVDGLDRVGVCVCRNQECRPEDWPTHVDHLIEAHGNPYYCSHAWRRENGDWFFPLQ